jgi:hypothetical protein
MAMSNNKRGFTATWINENFNEIQQGRLRLMVLDGA